MSNKKFQENLKRIAGIKDDQGGLDKQDVKDPIGSRRGIAYLTQGGTIATKSGTGGETVVDWDYSFDTYYQRAGYRTKAITTTRKKYSVECLKGQEGCTPPGVGDALATLDGLYDCATGDKADLNIAVDECIPPVTEINCVDVCVDPQPDPTYDSQKFWVDHFYLKHYYTAQLAADGMGTTYCAGYSGLNYTTVKGATSGALYAGGQAYNVDIFCNSGHTRTNVKISNEVCSIGDPSGSGGVCQTTPDGALIETCPAEIYTQQCEEHPWDTCECYHIEKRGTELKAGWDSAEMYKEAVNCGDDPTYVAGMYWTAAGSSAGRGWTAQGSIDNFVASLGNGRYAIVGDKFETYWVFNVYNSNGSLALGPTSTSISGCVAYAWPCQSAPTLGEGGDIYSCDQYPEKCQPPTEPEDYVAGYYWSNQSLTAIPSYGATPDEAHSLQFGSWANPDGYYLVRRELVSSTQVRYYYTNAQYAPAEILSSSSLQQACGASTEPYCNPDYSSPEDCEPYPLTQEQDCCPPQDATTPQGCMWSSDGKVTWNWDSASGTFKTNALDPDATQTVKSPETFNLCDQFGNPVTMRNSGGSLVIKYDPDGDGTGVTYKVGTGGTIEAIDTAAREGLY